MRLLIFSFLFLMVFSMTEARPHGDHGGAMDWIGKGFKKIKDKLRNKHQEPNDTGTEMSALPGPKVPTIHSSCDAYASKIHGAFSQTIDIANNAIETTDWILKNFQDSDDSETKVRLSKSLWYLIGQDATEYLVSESKREIISDLQGMVFCGCNDFIFFSLGGTLTRSWA